MKCIVANCKNSDHKKTNGIHFHRLPKNTITREKWILALGIATNFKVSDRSVVCSQHFDKADYEMNLYGRRILKNEVIPKLDKLPLISAIHSLSSSSVLMRDNYKDNVASTSAGNKPVVVTIPHNATKEFKPFIRSSPAKCTNGTLKQSNNYKKITSKRRAIKRITTENGFGIDVNIRKKKTRLIREDIVKLRKAKHNLLRTNAHTTRIIASLTAIIKTLKLKNLIEAGHADRLNELCEPLKSISGRVLAKQKITQVSIEIRAFALNLNFYSPKAYNYVRASISSCLPPPSTLHRWYKTVDAKPGLTIESFETISKVVQENKKSGKEVFLNLAFDEMSIKPEIEWTGTKSQYVGYEDVGNGVETSTPATLILVLMVVCVSGSWKIPIGFFPIKSMTAEQKANVITQSVYAIRDTGAKLIGITFDGCNTNLSAAKLLGCNVNFPATINTILKIPGIEDEIVMMVDPGHRIKLFRNHLAQRGPFLDDDNRLVNWRFLNNLLELGTKIYKQGIKIKYAVLIFGDSVADTLDLCNHTLNLKQFKNSEATSKYIRICNKAFDILNSRKLSNVGYKKPLCVSNFEEILTFSKFAIKYFSNLKFCNGKLLVQSPNNTGLIGIIVSLQNIEFLYSKYIKNGPLTDLAFHKFNRDHIESFLESIRCRLGNNNNPTVEQFIIEYRKLVCHCTTTHIGISNCMPLVEIPILQYNRNSSLKFINDTAVENQLVVAEDEHKLDDEELENLTGLLDRNTSLNEYYNSIVANIAGFVVFSLQERLKCQECIKLLEASTCLIHEGSFTINSFSLQKIRNNLKIPSEEILKVCLFTEKVLRNAISVGGGEKSVLNKRKYAKILISSQNVCQLKSLFSNSMHIHSNFLIRAVIEKYLNVRYFYITARTKKQISIRNHLTRLAKHI